MLSDGGLFLFSTFNEAGQCSSDRPWRLKLRRSHLRHPRQLAKRLGGLPLDYRNYLRHRGQGHQGDGWSIRTVNAHHFALVIHFITLRRQLMDLANAGFVVEQVFDNLSGGVVDAATDAVDTNAWWFHFVARKATLPRGVRLQQS